jgi:hypothetical protein
MSEPQDPGAGPAQPYGQPGYGPPPGYGAPPGYAPTPAYGPPGYGGYGYPPPGYPRPTNTMAILALVFAFVFAPAGLVMGIVARKQIGRTGEEGGGLALAGIVVGAIFSAIYVLLIMFWIIALTAISSGSGTF